MICQIINILKRVFNSTKRNIKFNRVNSNLIDWEVMDVSNKEVGERLIAVLSLKSKRVLPINQKNGVLSLYDEKKDFFDNINKIYDSMVLRESSYGILTTYEYTWFIRKDKSDIYISDTLPSDSTVPALLHSFFYFFYLASVKQ